MTKGNKSDSKTNGMRDLKTGFDGNPEHERYIPRRSVIFFILSIVCGAVYVVWYWSDTPTQAQTTIQAEEVSNTKVTFSQLAMDAELVEAGRRTFISNCVSCHGPLGGGLVGPNLTDDYWIHDPYFENLYRILIEGVVEAGMPPLGPVIGAAAAKASLAYIATLRGTTPANAKAPEGTPQALQ
jgi:cytochrome c oxidase cbb3-type subunit 3